MFEETYIKARQRPASEVRSYCVLVIRTHVVNCLQVSLIYSRRLAPMHSTTHKHATHLPNVFQALVQTFLRKFLPGYK